MYRERERYTHYPPLPPAPAAGRHRSPRRRPHLPAHSGGNAPFKRLRNVFTICSFDCMFNMSI